MRGVSRIVLAIVFSLKTGPFVRMVALSTTAPETDASRNLQPPRKVGAWSFLGSSGTHLDEVRGQRRLFQPVVDTSVHRRARIAHDAAASSLRAEVHVDSEEVARARALLANDFPLRNERLATCCPCLARRLNATWVEAKSRAVDDFGLVERATWVGLVEADKRGFVQIRDSDVTTRRTSVLVIDRSNVDEGVVRTSGGADSLGESAQSKVRGYD